MKKVVCWFLIVGLIGVFSACSRSDTDREEAAAGPDNTVGAETPAISIRPEESSPEAAEGNENTNAAWSYQKDGYENLSVADDVIWRVSTSEASQEYTATLISGQSMYEEEDVKKIFLSEVDALTIDDPSASFKRFEGREGALVVDEEGKIAYVFYRPGVPDEENREAMDDTPKEVSLLAQQELSAYFPKELLMQPQYAATFWDPDTKSTYELEDHENETFGAMHLIVYFEQVYSNGIPFDWREEGIKANYISGLLYSVDFSLYHYAPQNDSVIMPLPFDEVLSLIDWP